LDEEGAGCTVATQPCRTSRFSQTCGNAAVQDGEFQIVGREVATLLSEAGQPQISLPGFFERVRRLRTQTTVGSPLPALAGVCGWASGLATTSNSALNGAGPSRRRKSRSAFSDGAAHPGQPAQAPDVVAGLAAGVHALLVAAGAEVVVAHVRVGEQCVDDGKHGVPGRDQGSLLTDFENFTTFKPGDHNATALETLLDQVVAWSTALESSPQKGSADKITQPRPGNRRTPHEHDMTHIRTGWRGTFQMLLWAVPRPYPWSD
jgi:hypothetical protein